MVTYPTPNGYPRQFRWRGQVHDVVRVEGPERIAPEWWREKGNTRLRDYYRIEDSEPQRLKILEDHRVNVLAQLDEVQTHLAAINKKINYYEEKVLGR